MTFKIDERLLYVRPDGVKYQLHAPPLRAVLQEEGFGMPPLDYVADRAPFQHGNSVRSFTLGPRPVQLVVLQNFCSREEYWAGRAALLDAIRPNRITNFDSPGKLLYYLSGGGKRQLDVMPDTGPGFAPAQDGWREWSFTEALRFTAHDPAWYDPTVQTDTFSQSGLATFPMTFPVTFYSFGSTSDITYEGTWLEYPTFVITGPITGPRIENITTGELLALDTTIPAGMTATIVLRGRKTITRSDGTNLLSFLSSDSDLTEFALQPDPIAPNSVNQLSVSGSGTSGASQVVMTWYKRYIGI